MNTLKTIFKTVVLTAVLFSCDKSDDNNFDFNNVPTAAAFSNLKEEALANNTQDFQFNGEDGNVSLTSDSGVQISINTSCLTLNGSPVTGTVDLEYVELFEKGKMLTTDKPTMGILPNGDRAMLLSGGEFFLEATQNGQLLETNCAIQLIVPNDLTGGPDAEMILWEGNVDADGNLEWDRLDPQNGEGEVFVEGGEYYAFLGQFGWTNIDKFYYNTRPKTLIKAQAPNGYDATNSAIYLSYDGEDSGIASLDVYDSNANLFSEHYGQIPIGLECHVIFATEDNGVWRYAVKAVTIVADDIITFSLNETSLATETEFVDIINNLP